MSIWMTVIFMGTLWFVVLTTSWAICRICAEADARLAFERELEQVFDQ